jgi:large subunit ribosomal protein L24
MKLKIKKGDTVQVISGSDKGKKGAVLAVDPTALAVKVQGVKMMTHFDKKDGQKTLEGFIPYAKVKLVEKSGGDKKKPAKKKATKSASKTA